VSYKTEFPAVYHNIPAQILALGLDDISWGNDACPSFTVKENAEGEPVIRLWVDAEKPEDREYQNVPRFCIDSGDEVLLQTDDVAAVLAKIAEVRQ